MKHMFAAVLALAVPATVLAAPAPKPGASHSPPRIVDETTTLINVHYRSKGYAIYLEADVYGYTSKSDTLRLDWTQGGKTLVSGACKAEKTSDHSAQVTCSLDDKPQTAVGMIDAKLIYIDDQDNAEYVVRDYKVNVKKWASTGDPLYQILPDDLLAAGYVKHMSMAANTGRGDKPNFIFWSAYHGGAKDLVLRCTVDGQKLDDLDASISNAANRNGQEVTAEVHKGTETVEYSWQHIAVVPKNLYFGPKTDKHANGTVWLADHPGAWMCEVRTEGHALRELRFKVDDQGMVQSDAMNTGDGAVPLVEGVALIDLRIPKDSVFDTRVRPDAIKKSFGFGLPWPTGANAKTIQAAAPPASGLPDPK